MPALTSLLVRDQVASIHKIEEALQRQVLEGGEIDTILLELDAIPEDVLNSYRAALFGIAPATRQDVMVVKLETLEKVTKEIAEEFRIVPIAFYDNTLEIGGACPLSEAQLLELNSRLGYELKLRIASEVRVEAALAAHYGIQISGRMRLLAIHLEDTDPGELQKVIVSDEQKAIHFEEHFLEEFWSETLSDDNNQALLERHTANLSIESTTEPEPEGSITKEDSFSHGGFRERGTLKGLDAITSDQIDSIAGGFREQHTLTGLEEIQRHPLRDTFDNESVEQSQVHHHDLEPSPSRSVGMSRVVGIGATSSTKELPKTEEEGNKPISAKETPTPENLKTKAHPSPTTHRAFVPRGPLTPGVASELLQSMDERDEIVDLFFSFARQYFDCCILLAFRGDYAIGVRLNESAADSIIPSISIPIQRGSILDDIQQSPLPRITDLTRRKEDRIILTTLKRKGVRPVAVIPICIQQRVVLLLYGDRSGEHFSLDDISDLINIVQPVRQAFERMIRLQKALASQIEKASLSSSPQTIEDKEDKTASVEKKKRESSDIESNLRIPKKVTQDIVRPNTSDTPSETIYISDDSASTNRREVNDSLSHQQVRPEQEKEETNSAFDPSPTDSTQSEKVRVENPQNINIDSIPEPHADTRQKKPITSQRNTLAGVTFKSTANGKTVRSYKSVKTLAGIVTNRPNGIEKQVVDDSSTENKQEIEKATNENSKDLSSTQDAVRTPQDSTQQESDNRKFDSKQEKKSNQQSTAIQSSQDNIEQSQNPSEGSDPVISQMVRWSEPPTGSEPEPELLDERRHTLPIESRSLEPSVVINMGFSSEELLQNLCSMDTGDDDSAISLIVRAGDDILSLLEQRFPGPLWFDRNKPYQTIPSARDVSPISRAILAFDEKAVPHIRSLLASGDPDHRFYALILAKDIPHMSLLGSIERRIFDADKQIRQVALEVLQYYRNVKGYDNLLNSVRSVAASPDSLTDIRLIALEALASLCDTECLDILLSLLGSVDKKLVNVVHRALVVITAQDFGTSIRKWNAWIKRNKNNSRIEWLIDSLTHQDEAIRSRSGADLQKMTQEYYGYHPALPKRDRQRIQKKYQEWWKGIQKSK